MIFTIVLMIGTDAMHPPAVSTAMSFALRSGDASNLLLFVLAVAITAGLTVLQRTAVWLVARLALGQKRASLRSSLPALPLGGAAVSCSGQSLGFNANNRGEHLKSIESREAGFDAGRLQRVVEALRTDIQTERYDGAALHVGRHGKTVLEAVEGYADRATRRALAQDTVFVSMSIGKQYMNALVLSYVERGLLGLHMPVQEVLPEFGRRGKGAIKLWHLLTHTSGLMSAVPPLPAEVLTSVERLAAFAAGSLPEALPGERVNYSILLAHAVLAAMVLKVDGGKRTLRELLDAEVFQPLGMRDTSLGVRSDLRARLAPVAARYQETGLFAPPEVEGIGALVQMEGSEIPAGGYATTITDVARFAAMLQGGGELDGYRLLSPAMLKLAARNWTGSMPNSLMAYSVGMRGWEAWPASIGLGFFVRGEGLTPGPIGNLASPNSFGGWGAGSSCFWVDPERALTFSFLSTGLMEDSRHIERIGRLSDMVLAAVTR